MKTFIRHYVLAGLFLSGMNSFVNGQAERKSNWTIGDTLPDVELKGIINYKASKLKISEFNGKLLILDFWATWCAPCIRAMPKLDSLQRKFGDKIQILPIAYEDSATVKTFLKRLSKAVTTPVISVTNDKLLASRFYHKILPHYVWIDANRKVIAITEAEDVNAKNIALYLKGSTFSYTLKQDEKDNLIEIPSFPPSIQAVAGRDTLINLFNSDDLVCRTILTKYVEGFVNGGSFRDSTYISIRNSTVARLYMVALLGNSPVAFNTRSIEVQISDPELFMKVRGIRLDGTKLSSGLETIDWLKVNGYCYESIVPAEMANERFDMMLDELNRYFGAQYGIVGVKEKVNRKSLSLIRITDEDRLATKGGEPGVEIDRLHVKVSNLPISSFISRLELPLRNYPPLTDETNYSNKIDLDINCNISDLNALNKELEKYGLKFVEKEAMVETAVIRMKKDTKKNH